MIGKGILIENGAVSQLNIRDFVVIQFHNKIQIY
jgi:hypothetical protein